MEPRPLPHYTEGEYGTLDLPEGWHVASLACFALSLIARYLVRLLPGHRIYLTMFAVLALSGLGLLFGLLGLRKSRGRGLARAGVFLNATVLALSTLAVALFFYILPG